MTRKKLERVERAGKLSPERVERDRDIRRKVRAEFPPAPRRAVADSLTEALKRAIRESEMTVYQIAKKAHVSQIIISRFLSGERDIRVATADKLATALGLKLETRS